jgi:anaerobic ribonucleoside-triphosphate reductase activating protein
MYIPVNNISYSAVNGPGNRMVIWVQGCKLNCQGCFNPEMHAYSRDLCIAVCKLANSINKDSTIEGITVSGGEPLDFPAELSALLKAVNPNLTRIIFSGYTVNEIVEDTEKFKVVRNADLVIAGRFNNKLNHPYFGKKLIDVTGKVDVNVFLPRTKIEYSLNNNRIVKTGIFKHN